VAVAVSRQVEGGEKTGLISLRWMIKGEMADWWETFIAIYLSQGSTGGKGRTTTRSLWKKDMEGSQIEGEAESGKGKPEVSEEMRTGARQKWTMNGVQMAGGFYIKCQ